jgi:hypothetical protein
LAGYSRAHWLPLLALLLMAFSGLPLVACGASITHKPAAQLRLLIDINHEQPQDGAPTFFIGASLLDGATGAYVTPPAGAHITCNGVAMWHCPQQLPGSSYQITYTDEHGAATTVGVGVPEVAYAILSPVAGGTAPIPTDGVLTIRFAAPRFLPTWTVAIDRASAQCGAQAGTGQCAVEADAHGSVVPPAAPAARLAARPAAARSRGVSATSTPPATFTPPPDTPPRIDTPTPLRATSTPDGSGAPSPSSVTVTLNGSESRALLRGDYSRWEPGPGGRIALSLRAEGHVEPSGFQSVTVRVAEFQAVSVIWARS